MMAAVGAQWAMAVVAGLVLAASACSSDGGAGVASTTTSTTVARPEGPAAELTLLTGGTGINLVSTSRADLAAAGFVEEEYAAAGTATSYRAVGDLSADGTFTLEPDVTADYRTRVVARRPADAADFNGTVVVEWLNVSAGFDSSPDFTYLADELLRGGYAWVGVSAQRIGVEGGEAAVPVPGVPGGGLRAADPARYGDLAHPGDAFAYDIYTQVARALRAGGGALGDLVPERVLAVGESQSAFALTTYLNGVQPLTRAFDGFLVHSRGGAPAPLGEPGEGWDLAGSIGGPATRIRTDGDAPILVLQTETDVIGVLGYLPARQPDDDRFRLWEVAGTAHADAYQVGGAVDVFDCGGQINDGPQHLVAKAALRHLDTWVRTGEPPPEAPRLEVDESGAVPAFVRDADGLARGGIRTPPVDVPVATLSGDAIASSSVLCLLFGSTVPFTEARLAELYASPAAYTEAYEAAAEEAIAAGWVLEDDRAALLDAAQPEVIPAG